MLGALVVMHFNGKHRELGETGKCQQMRRWFVYGLVVQVCTVALARSAC